jgi:pimeloyl-ACP methyl ester carboxylesterase
MSKTVMLIHGAWVTPASFDRFRTRFEAKGYTVIAPPWPLEDRPIEELRRSPHPDLSKLTIKKIVDHYEKLIRDLPEPPILMGHSFGGLFVQLLLDRGLGAAGVAIDPVPPRGVPPGLTTLRTSLPIFTTWNAWNRILTMSPEDFGTGFAQTLPESEKRAAYDQYVVPTPGRIFFQGAFGIGSGANFKNPNRAPLLLIAGEKDRTIQPSMVRADYNKHRKSKAVTAFKSFPNRSHWLINERGWEEVADYAIEWASNNARRSVDTIAA